jgi:MarR family transcriptional regulator, temperature-dependent positive regulator of motility
MLREADTAFHASPTHLFHRVTQCINEMFSAEQTDASLTPRQASVLATIARHEGLSQTGLVELTSIDRSTLADIVRRLQKKGLLQRRRRREDARAYSVKLTEEGSRVARAAEPIMKRVDERILGPLPAKERARFLADLRTIVCLLEGKRSD